MDKHLYLWEKLALVALSLFLLLACRAQGERDALRENCIRLHVIAASDEAGVYIVSSKKRRLFYVMGHSEYDTGTLGKEYERDMGRGMDPRVPAHYFPDDDPAKTPLNTWRAHAHLLFSNWLNYFVYQNTPYDLNKLKDMGDVTL